MRSSEISTTKGEASFVGLASDDVNFEVVCSFREVPDGSGMLRGPKTVIGVGSSFDELPNEDWCWLGGGSDVGFSLAVRSDDGYVVGFSSDGHIRRSLLCCCCSAYPHKRWRRTE